MPDHPTPWTVATNEAGTPEVHDANGAFVGLYANMERIVLAVNFWDAEHNDQEADQDGVERRRLWLHERGYHVS